MKATRARATRAAPVGLLLIMLALVATAGIERADAARGNGPRVLLKLPGNKVKPADTLKFKAVCRVAPCAVRGRANIEASTGEQSTFKIAPDRRRNGGRFRIRVPLFEGAGAIARQLGGTVKLKVKVRGPRQLKDRRSKKYKFAT